MKSLVYVLLFSFGLVKAFAQDDRIMQLQQMEDELKPLAYSIMNDDDFVTRFRSDSAFIRG
jgi:hypothetical protein